MNGAPAPAPAGVDTNLVAAGLLRDLAAVQTVPAKTWGYKQAASAIMWLEEPLESLVDPGGRLARIPRIGPASQRVLLEVLATGRSELVDRAVDESGRRAEIERRRGWRRHFLSYARVRAVNADRACPGPSLAEYRGDLQMHSTWSDGVQTLED